jgi:hypothetical protein
MIDAISIFVGCASLIRRSRGTHQSRPLSEINSQFHDECSAAPGCFFIETALVSTAVRMNFVRAPYTLTTGCSPIVFATTPPHPASNARTMFVSDSVGGAEERRNGFSKRSPVKRTETSVIRNSLKTELRTDLTDVYVHVHEYVYAVSGVSAPPVNRHLLKFTYAYACTCTYTRSIRLKNRGRAPIPVRTRGRPGLRDGRKPCSGNDFANST